jgi:hypothetical protein
MAPFTTSHITASYKCLAKDTPCIFIAEVLPEIIGEEKEQS